MTWEKNKVKCEFRKEKRKHTTGCEFFKVR
jgi:hypothetical protein